MKTNQYDLAFFDTNLRMIIHSEKVTMEFRSYEDNPYQVLTFFIRNWPDALPDNFNGWVQIYDHSAGITLKIEFMKGR